MLSFCEDNLHIHNDKKHLHKQAYNPSLFPSLLLLLFATACCLLSLPLSHLTASPPIPTSSSHTHVHLVAIYHPRSLLLTSRPTTKPVPLETSIHQGSPWTATIMKPHPPQNPLDPVFLLLPPTLIPPLSNSQNPPNGVPHSLPLCRRPPALPPRITCTSSVYL